MTPMASADLSRGALVEGPARDEIDPGVHGGAAPDRAVVGDARSGGVHIDPVRLAGDGAACPVGDHPAGTACSRPAPTPPPALLLPTTTPELSKRAPLTEADCSNTPLPPPVIEPWLVRTQSFDPSPWTPVARSRADRGRSRGREGRRARIQALQHHGRVRGRNLDLSPCGQAEHENRTAHERRPTKQPGSRSLQHRHSSAAHAGRRSICRSTVRLQYRSRTRWGSVWTPGTTGNVGPFWRRIAAQPCRRPTGARPWRRARRSRGCPIRRPRVRRREPGPSGRFRRPC